MTAHQSQSTEAPACGATPSTATRNRVCDLNDAFRTAGPAGGGHWMLTRGVQAAVPDFIAMAVGMVRSFEDFTGDNDPYGEHDFGSFNLAGQHLFWKIDCYDEALEFGSPDPADPSVTQRVLTIMLASEY